MPRRVDPEERRAELLTAVWRVVARDGLEAVTVRSIARETGWSAGTLAHYFADKDDILTSALRLSHERIAARREAVLAGRAGVDALRELVLDNLPLDADRELETRLALNYWGRAITRTDMESSQWRLGPGLYERLTDLAAAAIAAGEIVVDESPADIAERLHALIDGFSLHALLFPERLDGERQTRLVDREFERLRGAHSCPTTG